MIDSPSIIAPTEASSPALIVWLTNNDNLTAIKQAVDQAVARARRPAGEDEIEGWTVGTLRTALDRLRADNGRVQAAVIEEAITKGGYLTRQRVCKIGGYPKDRMLRGFSRPAKRIVEAMKAAGEIPANATALLWASYQNGVQADGFHAPGVLVELLDDDA